MLAQFAGLPETVVVSLAPKSVTAAVAMGISESLNADPSLTAVAVILTGILGAIVVTPKVRWDVEFFSPQLPSLLPGCASISCDPTSGGVNTAAMLSLVDLVLLFRLVLI